MVKESGHNWEIWRGIISDTEASLAAREVETLLKQRQDWLVVTEFPFFRASTVRGTTRCDILQWPEADSGVAVLKAIAGQLAEVTGDVSGRAIINVYAPRGVIGRHRDNEGIAGAPLEDTTLAVGLVGMAEVAIEDAEGFKGKFQLGPTDALHLRNPRSTSERAWHSFRNIGNNKRIGLVD